jgi:hypothetical protein
MDRTVLDKAGNNWLASPAFLDNDPMSSDDGLIALDEQMGAGELDAKRAVQQFAPGEFNNTGTATVPAIGWDYGHTNGINTNIKYKFAQPLVRGSFVSTTVAFDRKVVFDTDAGTTGTFDFGDSFKSSNDAFVPGVDQINDLDLYLMPMGATSLDDAIALSDSAGNTFEHLFAQIPATGQYEFWINQFSSNLGDGQDYAVAWWADAVKGTAGGDYNGDNIVDAQDYNVWRTTSGATVTPGTGADGNNDGVIDAGDYVIWRKSFSAAGSGTSLASVPEPSAICLALIGLLCCFARKN